MTPENVLNNIVFVDSADLDALLESGFLPRPVIDRVVARGHVPHTHSATAKMVGQAAYFFDESPAVDVPGLYVVTVKCTVDEQDYFLRIEVAQLDWC